MFNVFVFFNCNYMGESEIVVFIVLVNCIILILIAGIVLFVLQYRKRKLHHEKEKAVIEKQHKLDLLNNQLQIQQQTMQFIGSEIHDSVAQKLTLASIYSQQLEFQNQHPDLLDKLGKISDIINDSLIELRDLAKTLANNGTSEESLLQLLQKEANRVNGTGICKMQVLANFNSEIKLTVKSFLFRVLQEFIQNSLKHSGCTVINIDITGTADGLSVKASDNGKGFENDRQQSGGMGLNNMKRRMHLIGGRFTLDSKNGTGTTLDLFIDNKNLLPV